MIDLHTHVLPGIDDGPAELDESLQLARAAVAAGISTLLATPHVSPYYPANDSTRIAQGLAELRAAVAEQQIALEILPGAEVAITRVLDLSAEELSRLTLGHSQWLLLEFPFLPGAEGLLAIVAAIRQRGLRVLVAHPERCPIFQQGPAMLRDLVEDGALCSITANSLVGSFGEHVRRFALELIRDGLVHNVASDAHDPYRRPPGIAEQLRRAGLHDELTRWLTEDVPAAILTGGEIPPRPLLAATEAPARSWWRGRGRASSPPRP